MIRQHTCVVLGFVLQPSLRRGAVEEVARFQDV